MMAPLGPGELLVAYALSGVTRGLIVALGAGGALALFVDFPPVAWGWATYFVRMSALTMAMAGIVAGLWSREIRPSFDGHEFRDHAACLSVGHVLFGRALAWDVAGTGDGQSVVSHDRRFRHALIGWSDSAPWWPPW